MSVETSLKHGVLLQKKTVNNSYMNNMIILNKDVHIYKLYAIVTKKTKTIINIDEAWVNAHHINKYIWVDYDGNGGWRYQVEKVKA